MVWKTLDDMDLGGKVVLTRVDINVPVEAGKVTDATRIERIVPTIRDILAKGGKPVLLAHFDRPKGKVVPEMSLRVTLPALEAALGQPVAFAEDCIGEVAAEAIAALAPGGVLLLENTRFHKGEEANDPDFAAQLAALGDVYCNDAFSAAHRAHASTEGLARLLPSCAGRLMQAELEALEKALGNPERPVVAVVGGAKVSTKLELLGNLIGRVDTLVIGGGMANTFLAAQGIDVGKSLCEHDLAETARDDHGESGGRRLLYPAADRRRRRARVQGGCAARGRAGRRLPAGRDDPRCRPASHRARSSASSRSRATLVWNGPLGAFEIPPFNAATDAAARQAAALTRGGAAAFGRRWRRHGRRAERERFGRGLHLRLDGGRRLPRVARGQDPARRRRARPHPEPAARNDR